MLDNVTNGQKIWRQIRHELEKNGVLFELEQGKTAVVSFAGATYMLSDNGGEFMLEKINIDKMPRAIPYAHNPAITMFTVVYRILQGLRGEEIDYSLDIDAGERIFY